MSRFKNNIFKRLPVSRFKGGIAKLIPLFRLKSLSWKLIPLFRLKSLSWKMQLGIGVGLLTVLALVAMAILWSVLKEPWVEQQVMLRVLEGDVEIYSANQEEFLGLADATWLAAGTEIIAKPGSLAVLQYHDGSAVKIEGPAEVHHSWSRSLEGQPLDAERSVGLEVFQGRVTVEADRRPAPGSLFEVRTPSAIGVVQGTVFEVVVDEQGGISWEMGGGTLWVAAVTVGSDLSATVALIPLQAGDLMAIPPLPDEWREDRSIYKKLMSAASDIARKAVETGSAGVEIDGTSMLVLDPETGIAIFKIDKVTELAISRGVAPQFPETYQVIKGQILAQFVPGLTVAKAPVVKRFFIPGLPTPEAWATAELPTIRTSPPSYLFSIYDLAKPMGVAVDPADQRIFITESAGNRGTRVFDAEGNQLMMLVPPDTVPITRSPTYVAVNRMGIAYVSDRMRHVIDMYDVSGIYLGTFNPTNNPDVSWSPHSLTFDSNGILYVTEITNGQHRVMTFETSGELKLEFGNEGNGAGEFSFPNGITVDSDGRIFVADSNNYRIQVFNAKGELLANVSRGGGEAVGFPRGIAVDGNYLYIVDTFGHAVRVFELGDGLKPAFTFGKLGVGDGEFNFPNGLALDTEGRLYITDRSNNRLQVWGY